MISNVSLNTFEVLELYDGQMAQLSNKKLISDIVPPLKYSARGKELFALSESFYCQWLMRGDNPALVEQAIELCRQAVAEGYPHAVVKMAFYYDKDYVALDRTEEFRCRVACDYYCKIAYCDETPKFADAVSPEIEWQALQRQAAGMLLDMLAGAQKSLAGYSSDKYSYDENLKRLKARYGISSDSANLPLRAERNREQFAVTVLDSCKHNRARAPLFGVMCLNSEEVKSLFAPKSTAMKLCGDVNIWVNGGKLVRANNTSAFNKALKELSGEAVWVYFFNNNLGGHKYLSGKQRKDLCELMMKDNYARFSRLKDSAEERGRSEYLFSDDDVRFFISNRLTPLKSALDGLIDRVVSDKDWYSV
ncbi:MAG: hypothetical protein HFJ81_06910 [Clostridia bacterium]|nr:hypothetical protein [Clostridia bacterium]